jgi:hypothetical protein
MAEPTAWLQCTVSKAEWDGINQRRLALKLSWKELILPAVLAYLPQLEANLPTTGQQEPPQAEPSTGKTKTKKSK